MAWMIDWNVMAVVIVVGLFALWKLELLAVLLNLKAFPAEVPAPLVGLMTAEKLAAAREYLRVNARFGIVQSTTSLTVLLVFWALGGFGWVDRLAWGWSANPVIAGVIFIGLLFLAQSFLGLFFDIYDTFWIEEAFGFNKSSPFTFMMDRVKGLLVGVVLGVPLLAAVLWIFNHVADAWLWAWLVVTVFQLAVTYLAPTWILPLFNKFTPMAEDGLKKRIEGLAERCGFPLGGVYVMDGSKRSTKANAFFTGLGKRKKIALFDTLVEKSSESELLGVLAHEIGHYRCGHIKQRLVVGVVQAAVVFYLLGLVIDPGGWMARKLFDAFGVAVISPHVGLVLFNLLMEPVGKVLAVVAHAWSRRHEFEADAYAAQVTGDPGALAEALKRLSTDHLSHPTPARLRVWLDYSHPPLLQRVERLLGVGRVRQ